MFEWPIFYVNIFILLSLLALGVGIYSRKNVSLKPQLIYFLSTAATFLSTVTLFQVDRIVHGTLYEYGLKFDYAWANIYWMFERLTFGLVGSCFILNLAALLIPKLRRPTFNEADLNRRKLRKQSFPLFPSSKPKISEVKTAVPSPAQALLSIAEKFLEVEKP